MLEVGWRFAVAMTLDQVGLEVVGLEVVGLVVVGLEVVDLEVVDLEAALLGLDLGKVERLQAAADLSFDQLSEPLGLAVVVGIDVVDLGTVVAVVGLDTAAVVAVDLDIAAAAVVVLDTAGAAPLDLDSDVAGVVGLDTVVAGLDTAVVAADLVLDIAVEVVGIVLAVPGIDLDAVLGTVPDAAGTVAVLDVLVELVGTEVLVLVDAVQDVAVGNIVVAISVDDRTCAFRGWLDLSDAQRRELDGH